MSTQQVELIHTPDYQKIKDNFLSELTLASEGKPSSISFLKNQLHEKPLVTKGIIQGIVIGGTNYILATEDLNSDGTSKTLKKQKGILPVFETKQTLMEFFSKYLDPQADAIGINFGFPIEASTGSDGEIDGKFIYGTKEHEFQGLIGKSLGELVKTLFQQKYHKRPIVSIANDTICLALSGNGTEQGAFIAGTGFNMGIVFEEHDNKILVNLESGNFNKFSLSPILKQLDALSERPGEYLMEKAISGKYLAKYFNEKIKRYPEISPIKTSQDLSELSHENHHDISGDLARAIITRSAYLIGAAIAATYEFAGKPDTFTLIGEGSLLWDGWHYQENIYKQLGKLGVPQDTIMIKHIKDSSINGAIGLITK